MKKKLIIGFIFVLLSFSGLFVRSSPASFAEPVSPGVKGGLAVTGQDCPTFSWSASSGAMAYRLEIYELAKGDAMSREQMRHTALPVVTKEILAPAFAWTAPLGECLERGMNYVWYVQGLDAQGDGVWSEGRVFAVGPQALTLEQEEAAREVVKEYFQTELLNEAGGTVTMNTSLEKPVLKSGTVEAISGPMSFEGNYNTFLGTDAGHSLTSPATGTQNATFIGLNAGYSTTSGEGNTFVGSGAGYSNDTGSGNSAFGMKAGYSNTGDDNGYFGLNAGYNNTDSGNNFFGAAAGYGFSGGNASNFFGYYSGYYHPGGSYNNFFGSSSGINNNGTSSSLFGAYAGQSSKSSNSFFGARAGYNNSGGNFNVFLGYKAGNNEGGWYRLYIANSDTSSPLIYGEFDNAVVKINGELVIASDERLKKNIKPIDSALDRVMQLEGVSYEWKSSKSEGREFASDREIGLLAQNVETVFPELVHTDGRGYKAVAYDKMAAVMVVAMKEQQKEMEQSDAYIEALLAKRANFEAPVIEKAGGFAPVELPEQISPGVKGGLAMTGQDCPTFSWSAGADAVAYRLEVYELAEGDALSHDQMRQTALPVVTKEIPASAFTWTASIGECFERGVNYVWYVQGLNAQGEGGWSEGRMFVVEPQALTLEQEEAAREIVKEYIETERLKGAESINVSLSETAAEISLPLTLTEGTTNTLLGTIAGNSLTDPGTNDQNLTLIGAYAGKSITSGVRNTFVGKGAGYYGASYNNNCFFGDDAGFTNSGNNNSFLGYRAGYNSASNSNSFLGKEAGNNNNGLENSFVGYRAGFNIYAGSYNSFFGRSAGYSTSGGGSSYNSFFGDQTGYNITTGSENSFFGFAAGNNNDGSGNVFVGYKSGYNETGSNKLYISNSDTASPLIYGEFDNGVVKINGELVMASDERLKKNIRPIDSAHEKVMQIEGVSYEWKSANSGDKGFGSGRKIGLLAQNVEAVFPELVHTDGKGYKAVAYNKMMAVLIEAFKEQQIKRQQKEAYFDALLNQKEAQVQDTLKKEDLRFEAVRKEKDARIEELTVLAEELSARIAAMENPSKTLASK